ncbi:retron St85 family RNA-directed DNA polymerase [Marinobacterium stanieri]|uniref:RNA-directed DNA polymerase n=1 Tax=Marinobacterium stanieri TaxID=49186 RepID=A0A1N6XY79_9GAMM|nr:retron St85 family RNA-directed DNA polymerase [Marinobacterium stanieri]SIR07191.1 Reverse transcriptase (RNA-dependent DNA polymerase) [Marinobacterium stanieri]
MSVLEKLAITLGKEQAEVESFLLNAPNKYKVYSIPKRTHGNRIIAQPSRELKKYQRAFIDLYEVYFPVHKNAFSYKKGIGIKQNAEVHKNNPYLLKMDLENFFNSIVPNMFWEEWERSIGDTPNKNEIKWIERILFWSPSKKSNGKMVLSIGAPSSPLISNFVMHSFDKILTSECEKKGVSYTRYADDMTFSTKNKNTLFSLPETVSNVIRGVFGNRVSINRSKTVYSSKAHNRHVTGVTLTNEGKVSLGRDRKRYIKHLIFEYQKNNLDAEKFNHLRGLIAFARYIEPCFIDRLENKYSARLVKKVMDGDYE